MTYFLSDARFAILFIHI